MRSEEAPRLPDVDDEQLRADEEDDERLDHRREIDRQSRLEDLGIELARRGADLEGGEQKRREENAHGLVATEEGDRDAGEGDEVGGEVARRDAALEAEKSLLALEGGGTAES